MKETIMQEVFVCERCGAKSTYMHECRVCGKTLCDKHAHKEFAWHMEKWGNAPGFIVCKGECEEKFQNSDDPLYTAIRRVEQLWYEFETFNKSHREKYEAADAEVEQQLKRRR